MITPSGGTGPYTFTLDGPAIGSHGTLLLNAATGTYTYTLTTPFDTTPDANNGTNPEVAESFQYTVTDVNGDTATGTILVAIIDDVPTAVADIDSVAAGTPGPATGNVLTGGTDAIDSNTTDGVADVQGADGAVVVGGVAGTINADLDDPATLTAPIQGAFGKLTLAADGSYSYTRDPGTAGGVSDVFTYTIKDGDGDLSHTTLTISIGNSPPTITNLTPAAGGGDVTVNEDDLLASRGAGELAGSDTSKESLTQTGTFTVSSPDGIKLLTIDGHTVISNDVFTATSFTTSALGNTLSVTGYDAATGVVSYSYTLLDNETHAPGAGTNSLFENLAVVLTDQDNQTANDTLVATIIDDVPTAVADIDSVAAGTPGPATGNVLTGGTDAIDSNTTDGVADVQGADGAVVVGGVAGTINADLDDPATLTAPIQGAFGKLTLAADGSYSYTRDPGTAGGVSDVFTYTIKDGDGDLSHTTLTISIGNSPPTITNLTPAAGGGDVTVNEDDLLASRGVGESAGSDTSKESLTQTGTFTVSSPDGIKSLTIDGHTVISNDVFTATSFTTSALGNTLSVTGYDAATGVVSYSYTLLDNETHAPGAGTNSLFENLAVVLTDQDNQTANDTLVATIIDDVPTAVADIDSVAAGTPGPATGNVLTGGTDAIDSNTTDGVADVQGADGAVVVGGVAGTINADLDNPATLTAPIQGAFGKLTLAAGGSYSYTRDPGTAGGVSDVFTYTIKDGDGDLSHTTLTISIGNSPPTITNLTPAAGGGDVTVNEDDLLASRGVGELAGSDTSKESLTQTGTFTVSSPDGIKSLTIDGHTVISNDVFTATSFTTSALGNTLSVTGYDAATGVVSYSYTLLDNETHAPGAGINSLFENLAVALTDQDNQTANDTLVATIIDDVPTAVADIDSVAAGTPGPATGNVLTGGTDAIDSNTTDGVADVQGADGAVVVGGVAGTINADLDDPATLTAPIQGAFGKLTLAAGGSYSYTRDPGTPGGVSDVFTYTIKDGDGDLSHTTLTISIGNSPPTITNLTPAAGGGDVTVNEDDLLASRGVGELAGSDTSKESLTQTGTFTVSSPDGIKLLTIDGHTVISNDVFTATSFTTSALGNTLSVTGYDAATGVVSYSYTLLDNETHAAGAGINSLFENLAVALTDQDNQTANDTLVATIIDDVPTAVADIDSVAAGTPGPATGNVLTGGTDAIDSNTTDGVADVQGADGAVVVGGVAGTINADLDDPATLTAPIQGAFGKLTLAAGGSYSYTRDPGTPGGVSDVFTYTIKDGDGDLSHTTLTISIGNSPPTITNLTPAAGGGDVTVNEDDLLASRGAGKSAGSDTSKESLTQTGTFTVSSPDGIKLLTIDGHTVISNDVFTATSFTTSALGNTLSVTGYDAATGVVSYSYTLLDNETHAAGAGINSLFENLAVALTDQDNQTANDTLVATIIDDVPTAVADIDSVAAGTPGPATGNVLTGGTDAIDSNTTDGVADVQGADGAVVVGGVAGTINADLDDPATLTAPIQGAFGKLTLAAGGSYSYTRDPGTPGGVSDVFTYTIKDGDGDLSHTTLTISIGNSPPTITNLTPAAGGGDVTVNEDDLLASRGAGELAGSDTSKESLTQTGTFTVSSPDGIKLLTIDGHTVISNDVFTATSFTTSALGNTLSVTGYDAATGVVSYSYTLLDNETHAAGAGINSLFENLAVALTDQDNQTANDTLVATIIDDVPTAVADIDSVAAGTPGPATGNVLTGGTDAIDSNTTDGVADVQGADGAVVVGGVAGTINADLDDPATLTAPIQGAFGKLTLAAGGSYSYTRDPGTPGGVSDVFTYTIKDGDGDLSHTTLTISIGNSPPTITNLTPAAGGGDVTVNEDDLLASRGAGELAGSDTSKESLTQTGTFTVSSPDGIKLLTIDGHTVISNDVFTATSFTTSALGNTLSVTGYDAATGVVSYSYTLLDNETHAAGAGINSLFENLAVALTDQDNQTANDTLVATIIDDVPTAVADIDSVAAGTPGPATGNVLTGGTDAIDSNTTDGVADVQGADGAVVVGGVAGTINADLDDPATLTAPIQGAFGKLTLAAGGSYSYTRDPGTPGGVSDVFTYTIKDGDGDLSHTTLTISIGNSPPTITNLTPAAGGGDVTVNEDDLLASRGAGELAGSDTSKESLTQTGTFTVSSPDGIKLLTIDGHTVISNDVFTATSFTTSALGNTLSVTGYDAATGVVSYSYTLLDNETHAAGAGINSLFENLAVALTDQDNQTANDTLVATIIDDVPTAVADIGNVNEGALLTVAASGVLSNDVAGADGATIGGVRAAGGDTTTAVSGGVGTNIAGLHGTLHLNADGSYTYQSTADNITAATTDVFTYTLKDGDGDLSTTTLTINLANATVLAPTDNDVTVNENALDTTVTGSDLAAGTVTGSLGTASPAETDASNQLNGSGGFGTLTYALVSGGNAATAGTYGTIQVHTDGSYVYTLTRPFDTTPDANNGTNTEVAESFTYKVTDANGNTATGTITVNIIDDIPTAVVPQAAVLPNGAGIPFPFALDNDLTLSNNYGADGGTVVFLPSLNGTPSGLTSHGTSIIYNVSPDGHTLTGVAGPTTVFVITLDPATATYSVDMNDVVDSTTRVDFNSGAYNFVGGNTEWAGFTKPAVENSPDLLLTPQINHQFDGSINTNANEGGVGIGGNVGPNVGGAVETFRIDFVTDLSGDPGSTGPGDYDTLSKRDHVFDGHYITNGASATFTATSGATVNIRAFDDPDTDGNVVGPGAQPRYAHGRCDPVR